MIDILKEAINKIPEHYYKLYNPRKSKGQLVDYSNEYVFPERNYCTNLYHQLLNIINDTNLDIGEMFFLDEEIYKKYSGTYINDKSFTKTKNSLKFSKQGLRPDLVLHKSQQSREKEDQKLIIECKTTNNLLKSEFFRDFFKLNIYKSQLNFQNTVYIIVNMNKEIINKYLDEYLKKYWNIKENAIYLLIKESYGSEIIEIKVEY